MMIFRLSQKLSAKIKAGPLESMALDENPLTDWSAQLFVSDLSNNILFSNTKSLFSTVLSAKGITNADKFIERALSGIRELMGYYEHEAIFERMTSTSVRFAKALNRSITGSMNDLIKHATYWLAVDELPLDEISIRLNKIPRSALGNGKAGSYGYAYDVFEELVSGNEG
jgi:hypothetical protein